MEDDDNSNSRNQFNDDGDENRIVQQLLLTYISCKSKQLFCFKSVCKHWQTLISHPSFCRFYYSILNSSSRPLRILDRVLAMSNGLILCCSWSPTFVYYICDPLTRQWITLPSRRPRSIGFIGDGLITRVNEDHMLIGYTIVMVELQKPRSNYLCLEMFSSETGKWIVYKLPCPIRLWELADGAIYCYGALHWLVRYDEGIYGMLAFDPYKDPKSVRLIPLPDDRDLQSERDNLGGLQLCGESQGTLRYFEVSEYTTHFYLFTMWAMKDYKKGEWCCEFKVRQSDLHSNDLELSNWLFRYRWFRPLSFHPLNPNVVYLICMDPERIVSYNILNRRLDFASKPIDFRQCISSSLGIPFVLPRWPLLVPPVATVKSIKESVKYRK
ncbi:unnamed protein product [Lactuca virosa]|uniref:F-box protein At3g26010-like beta-propeller domain-containing protein n=1 Tax=Lactuca virosa TaxID=75947 RepID=A0AAU9MUP8_9ASTR|nr:unnamed protein product [Lactuca virosa]